VSNGRILRIIPRWKSGPGERSKRDVLDAILVTALLEDT